MRRLVIAIDGPSGAGKSTVAKEVARRLGISYVNTGDMYRICGILAKRKGVPFKECRELEGFLKSLRFTVSGDRLLVNGEDLWEEIRSEDAGKLASDISKIPMVRKILVEIQRKMGEEMDVVMEGRDIGTNVFPDTPYKFFLDASLEVRAKRRAKELREMGLEADEGEIKRKMEERDLQDKTRKINPLRPAEDAKIIDTTDMTVEEVVKLILEEVLEGIKG